MRIEHVAMYVNDPEKARDFFVMYLGGKSNEGYCNRTSGFRSYFICFEDGSRLEIMTRPSLHDPEHVIPGTGYDHIAFSVGSRKKVDQLTEQIRAAGYTVLSGPRITGDGYYESCIAVIEGNLIEITE